MTDATFLIPAARYLRMSTEHQQYSLENQSTAIQKYAEAHGFEVVLTYSDAAKSGVVLRHRAGLRQLLRDVVGGSAPYKAILGYDVSDFAAAIQTASSYDAAADESVSSLSTSNSVSGIANSATPQFKQTRSFGNTHTMGLSRPLSPGK